MKVTPALRGVAAVAVLALALPGAALAARPEPGPFTGSIALPIFERKSQPLQFTVGGDRRRMFAFDIPTCFDQVGRPLFANRVVRPAVSRSGQIKGRLDYERGGSNATVRRYVVRVSGTFVTATRARGKVRVTITVFRALPGQPRVQLGRPCTASGAWKARHA